MIRLPAERLDAIVLDVPLEYGVLEGGGARWRWSVEQTGQIVKTQRELFEKAAHLARPGRGSSIRRAAFSRRRMSGRLSGSCRRTVTLRLKSSS